jgi:hypothetical protein
LEVHKKRTEWRRRLILSEFICTPPPELIDDIKTQVDVEMGDFVWSASDLKFSADISRFIVPVALSSNITDYASPSPPVARSEPARQQGFIRHALLLYNRGSRVADFCQKRITVQIL